MDNVRNLVPVSSKELEVPDFIQEQTKRNLAKLRAEKSKKKATWKFILFGLSSVLQGLLTIWAGFLLGFGLWYGIVIYTTTKFTGTPADLTYQMTWALLNGSISLNVALIWKLINNKIKEKLMK